MAQIYTVISIVSYSLAAVFFVISCFMWFRFKIPKIAGDLSGRTAKKSIEKMRKKNEESGNKSHKATPVARARGKKTETIDEKFVENKVHNDESTELLSEDQNTELLNENNYSDGTELLNNNNYSDGTELLNNNNYSDGTELLQNETELLSEGNNPAEQLEVIDSIVLIHSNEII